MHAEHLCQLATLHQRELLADAARVGLARRARRTERASRQPRPTKGMPAAITVMNSTLASDGRLAM